MNVTTGQLALLLVTIGVFVVGGAASLGRVYRDRGPLRVVSRVCLYGGIGLGLAVLIWHSAGRGSWFPLDDNFDALVWLGLMLAGFVAYVQAARPLRGLDWFVMPIAVLLLVAAAVFGRTQPHEYVASTWSVVHRVSSYTGAVAFAVSAAVGVMYLIVQRNLRHKPPVPGPRLGSLERLEHWVLTSVFVGFALLTIGLITGVTRLLAAGGGETLLGPGWAQSPKVWLASAVWVVYAIVLHSPINPSFRGRKAAVLSVVGFVLMVGTLVAVQYMPAAPKEEKAEPQITQITQMERRGAGASASSRAYARGTLAVTAGRRSFALALGMTGARASVCSAPNRRHLRNLRFQSPAPGGAA